MKKYYLLLLMLCITAKVSYASEEHDTDLFVLKNGYTFKANIIDTSGKYYVYKVYRGERLLRCVKKTDVAELKVNYVAPPVASVPKPDVAVPDNPTPTPAPEPPKPEKKPFNPYTVTLNIRKGFEVIDTVRILYNQDLSRYHADESAINAFSSDARLGPQYTQAMVDAAKYQGPKTGALRNGTGILYFDDGSLYSGKVVNNVMSGYGSYSDDFVDYKGIFASNTFNGPGLAYYFGMSEVLHDVVFKGTFKNGYFWEGELYYTNNENTRFVQLFKEGRPGMAKKYDE